MAQKCQNENLTFNEEKRDSVKFHTIYLNSGSICDNRCRNLRATEFPDT